MPPKLAVGLKACGLVVALSLATASAAEQRPSLVGATREQVLARYGEPRSQMIAGNRVILFYAQERIVLRDGRVIEVERLADEPVRRPAPSAPAAAPVASEAPKPAPTPPAIAPGDPTAPPVSAPAVADPGTPAPSEPPPPAAAEPKFEIKLVRPPGSAPLPAPVRTAPAPAPAATAAPVGGAPRAATSAATAAPPAAQGTPIVPAPTPPAPPAPTARPAPAAGPLPAPATNRETVSSAPVREAEKAPPPAAPAVAEAPAPAAETPKAKAKAPARRLSDRLQEPIAEEPFFTAREYAIAFVIVAGGLAALYWRYRQRQLELAATAVTRAPFSPPAPTGGGTVFTQELLGKLEWKRFEELVAAYYSKTGVVAVRTKEGPSAPVNIKISWKGEPRPFACVKCLAQVDGLIDVSPLQALVGVLAQENIRRGYIVTSGKFNVEARDLAEEKHLTLLSGDLFLEKLNALPEPARAEIMRQATAGDYTTPVCPKCEAKLLRSLDDPNQWQCAAHLDVRMPVRK